MITITAEVAHSIATHAEATYPDECVGLLIGQIDGSIKIVSIAYPVENRWQGQVRLASTDNTASRRDRFYLDPHDYLRADHVAREQGLDIIGCYHSHPDHKAEPSERDRVGAQGVGGGTSFAFMIQSVAAGKATEVRSWILDRDGATFSEEELIMTE